MSALTLRLPDDKHQRLKTYAKAQGTSLNRLIDDMTTQALLAFDVETRFKARALAGAARSERGLALLDKAMQSSAP